MTAELNNPARLKKSQIKPAGEMLARAFQDDPLFIYFTPDASERKRKTPYLFRFLIRYGILYGEIHVTSANLEGVAVWLPSEKADITLWRGIRSGGFPLVFKLGWKVLRRQMYIDHYKSLIHKHHAPFRHWYLVSIGVDPGLQGKGYASALLKAMLARIDQEHLPCYLETNNEKNVAIYQHYGFKVVGEVTTPNTEVVYWAMLRETPV